MFSNTHAHVEHSGLPKFRVVSRLTRLLSRPEMPERSRFLGQSEKEGQMRYADRCGGGGAANGPEPCRQDERPAHAWGIKTLVSRGGAVRPCPLLRSPAP